MCDAEGPIKAATTMDHNGRSRLARQNRYSLPGYRGLHEEVEVDNERPFKHWSIINRSASTLVGDPESRLHCLDSVSKLLSKGRLAPFQDGQKKNTSGLRR